MKEILDHAKNFTAFRVYEAIYQTEQREETILLEFRLTANEEELLFTIIDGKPIYANSIHEFVYSLPSLISLRIQHPIRLLWNGSVEQMELVEAFSPNPNPELTSLAYLQLSLVADNQTYETTVCDTLQDAIWELQELTETEAEWWLCHCYHCRYSGHARDYAVTDRRYWCYRDVQEAFLEIQAKGKYASSEARHAGRYFVDAFHSCAAWEPIQINPVTKETADKNT